MLGRLGDSSVGRQRATGTPACAVEMQPRVNAAGRAGGPPFGQIPAEVGRARRLADGVACKSLGAIRRTDPTIA